MDVQGMVTLWSPHKALSLSVLFRTTSEWCGLISHTAVLPRVPVGIPSALGKSLSSALSLCPQALGSSFSPGKNLDPSPFRNTEKKVRIREDLTPLCSPRACQTPTWFFESSNISWVSREPCTQQKFMLQQKFSSSRGVMEFSTHPQLSTACSWNAEAFPIAWESATSRLKRPKANSVAASSVDPRMISQEPLSPTAGNWQKKLGTYHWAEQGFLAGS